MHYFQKDLGRDLKDCEQRVDDGVEVWGWGALGEVQLAAEKLRKMLIVNEMMLVMIVHLHPQQGEDEDE